MDLKELAYMIEAGQVENAKVLGVNRMDLEFKNYTVTIYVERVEEN